jgi:hypothetical protein
MYNLINLIFLKQNIFNLITFSHYNVNNETTLRISYACLTAEIRVLISNNKYKSLFNILAVVYSDNDKGRDHYFPDRRVDNFVWNNESKITEILKPLGTLLNFFHILV